MYNDQFLWYLSTDMLTYHPLCSEELEYNALCSKSRKDFVQNVLVRFFLYLSIFKPISLKGSDVMHNYKMGK